MLKLPKIIDFTRTIPSFLLTERRYTKFTSHKTTIFKPPYTVEKAGKKHALSGAVIFA